MQAYPLSLVKSYLASYEGLPKACYRGFVLSLIESIFIGIYYYLTIYFIDVLHLDITTSGIIMSCYGIGAILGGVLSGKLSDEFSAGIVSTISLLIQACVYIAFLKIKAIPLLMCNVFILGIASYGFITSNHLWVLNFCKEDNQRLKAINILSTTSNLGLGLSAMLISEVITFGFIPIFFATGCILFLLTYISFLYDKNNQLPTSIHSSKKVTLTEKNTFVTNKSKREITTLILVNVFFIGLIIAQYSSTYTIYIKKSYPELGIKAVTLLFALNSFMVVFFETPLGCYIKKYNKIMMVGVGGFLIGLGMLILTFSYSFVMALIACFIYTIGEIIFFCMTQLICYQNGHQNKKGRSLGMYRMIFASSRVFGPLIGGIIYAKMGGSMIWLVSGIIGLLCFISCYYYKQYD